jgi:hypothetical protein
MDSAALSARLRKFRPSRLVAVGPTGEKRNIAVPTGRRRKWDFALRALEHLDWLTLELLDDQGGILDIIDNRAGADDGELVEVTPDAKHAGMLELMLRAQDVALMRQERATSQLLDGYTKLVQTFAERLSSMERGYASVLQLAQQAALAQADAKPDMGDEIVRQFMPGIAAKVMGKPK